MTLPSIRNAVKNYAGKQIIIDYDLGRNKNEILSGTINKLYNRIFTVKLDNGNIRSFSYADYITKTIKITTKT